MTAGEGLDGLAEVVTDSGEEGRRGDGVTEVAGEEGDHLAAHLKGGDIGVEVDAIEALKIEDHVLIEELVDVRRPGLTAIVEAWPDPSTSSAQTIWRNLGSGGWGREGRITISGRSHFTVRQADGEEVADYALN